ncbi:hypothetical protein GGS24DRAFT_116050 [Hypoxylon argillaceum]|nr:hypothetical protein GGS24DRAFT_116050 [Hypoxylon argillaceum]
MTCSVRMHIYIYIYIIYICVCVCVCVCCVCWVAFWMLPLNSRLACMHGEVPGLSWYAMYIIRTHQRLMSLNRARAELACSWAARPSHQLNWLGFVRGTISGCLSPEFISFTWRLARLDISGRRPKRNATCARWSLQFRSKKLSANRLSRFLNEVPRPGWRKRSAGFSTPRFPLAHPSQTPGGHSIVPHFVPLPYR